MRYVRGFGGILFPRTHNMYHISAILFQSASAIKFGVWGYGKLSIFIQPFQHSMPQKSCFSCILFLCFSISIKKCSLLHHDIQIMAGKSKRCVRASCGNVYNLHTRRMGIQHTYTDSFSRQCSCSRISIS